MKYFYSSRVLKEPADPDPTRDDFLKKLFAQAGYCQELFHKLCKQGCPKAHLIDYLRPACGIPIAENLPGNAPRVISTAKARRIVNELRALAALMLRLNRTSLNPKLLATHHFGEEAERYYETLPFLMFYYSCDLEDRMNSNLHLTLRRLTSTHDAVLQLLMLIEDATGSPSYEDTANLLTAGFLASGGVEKRIPKLFSADALAKLKQRADKIGLTAHR